MNVLYLISKIIKKVHIPAIKNSKIDKTSRVCSASEVTESKIGRYSYIGNYCSVVSAEIGNFCSIADNCIIGGANHAVNWVSTSPVFHNGRNIMKKNFSVHSFEPYKKTTIGNDVWIGSNCLIKGGITIGNGAIIGMGSVVTKSVGEYEIWAGTPAKLIKKRFSDDTIEKLQLCKWWDYDDIKLKQNAINFNNTEEFVRKL